MSTDVQLTEPITPDDEALIAEYIKTRTKASAGVLANKLKSAASFEILRQIKAGVVDRAALTAVLTALSDKEVLASARYSVAEAFGFGRSVEAEREKDDIDRCQYSAILDSKVCSVCEPLDGEEWPFDDPRTDKYASGNPDCLGGNMCRCLLVYIAKSETKAVQ
jgi:hypothetical protein